MKNKRIIILVGVITIFMLTIIVGVISGVKHRKNQDFFKSYYLDEPLSEEEMLTRYLKVNRKNYKYISKSYLKNLNISTFLVDGHLEMYLTGVKWNQTTENFSYKALPVLTLKTSKGDFKSSVIKDIIYDRGGSPSEDHDKNKLKKSGLVNFTLPKDIDYSNLELFIEGKSLEKFTLSGFDEENIKQGFTKKEVRLLEIKWLIRTYIWWELLICTSILASFFLLVLKNFNSDDKVDTLFVAEGAMMIALALVFDYLAEFYSRFIWPMGGSISLAILPIVLISIKYGAYYGTSVGMLVGATQIMWAQSSAIVHPFQVLLDYVFAYGAIGISGVFSKLCYKENDKRWKLNLFVISGLMLGTLLRYIMHVVSGVVFFSSYAPKTISPLVYSLAYNAGYIFISLAINLLVITVLVNTSKQLFFRKELLMKYQKESSLQNSLTKADL